MLISMFQRLGNIIAVSCFMMMALGQHASAGASACLYNELVHQPGHPDSDTRSYPSFPWEVTINEIDGYADVRSMSDNSKCRIELEDVRKAYGGRATLILRVTEVSADYLFYFNPATCRLARKSLSLGISNSFKVEKRALHKAGICTD